MNKEQYEQLYMENYKVSGYGIEGTTNHFPCPFCAAPDFHVVRIVDFGPPRGHEGDWRSEEITCEACGRSVVHTAKCDEFGNVEMSIVQTGGDDPPEYVPILREGA